MSPKKTSPGQVWLDKHKEQFGTHDGLPGEFHRQCLADMIKGPGTSVMIETYIQGKLSGQLRSGRTVMRSPNCGGWVVNLGGPHGTPGLVNERNVVWVSKNTLFAR